MAAHLRECAKLDRELRAAAQTRTIFDPEVRRLRAALRDQCEAALLSDLRLSQVRGLGGRFACWVAPPWCGTHCAACMQGPTARMQGPTARAAML